MLSLSSIIVLYTSILNRALAINSLEISVDHFLVLAGLGWLFEVRMCMRSRTHIMIQLSQLNILL